MLFYCKSKAYKIQANKTSILGVIPTPTYPRFIVQLTSFKLFLLVNMCCLFENKNSLWFHDLQPAL